MIKLSCIGGLDKSLIGMISKIYDKETLVCRVQPNTPINYICISDNKRKDIIPTFPITYIDINQLNIGIYFIQDSHIIIKFVKL